MRTIYFFLCCVAVVALSSCSSAYKSGQTPDDVYYSPGTQRSSVANTSNNGEYYNANPNDQYLMMRVQDPERWSTFDDYNYGYAGGYGYSPYSYGYGGGGFGIYGFSPFMSFGFWNPYYSYYNSYYAWNSFYNPYYGAVVVVNSHYPVGYSSSFTQLHPFNLNSYTNSSIRNSNTGTRSFTPGNNTAFRNSSSGSNYRRFNNQNSNSNYRTNNSNFRQQNSVQPTRSYSPAPSSFGGGFNGGGGRSFGRSGRG